jgi:hypothetical protein
MIAFNEMDFFAVQKIAIGRGPFNVAQAPVPEKIQCVVWLDAPVHPIRDARIHLVGGRERSIAGQISFVWKVFHQETPDPRTESAFRQTTDAPENPVNRLLP